MADFDRNSLRGWLLCWIDLVHPATWLTRGPRIRLLRLRMRKRCIDSRGGRLPAARRLEAPAARLGTRPCFVSARCSSELPFRVPFGGRGMGTLRNVHGRDFRVRARPRLNNALHKSLEAAQAAAWKIGK